MREDYKIELAVEKTMHRKGYSVIRLADESGINYEVLRNMISGKTRPNIKYLERLAEVLKVKDITELIDFKVKPEKKPTKW